MPELDGYETLTRIKSDERLRHLPVIVISSVEDLDSVIRCIKIGATDHLPKPFNPELLGARLNASLAEKRLHDLEWSACNRSAASWTRRPPSRPRRSSRTASTPSPSGATRSVRLPVSSSAWRARSSSARRLKAQVQRLRIEIDEARAARKVAEITDTDYFRDLQQKAGRLRLDAE